jgi:hypothetical protein
MYRLAPTALCDCGGNCVGDVRHVLLDCPKHSVDRQFCVESLARLYVPISLTLDLLLGLPPPPPDKLKDEKAFLRDIHISCLHITGALLLAIDKRIHL